MSKSDDMVSRQAAIDAFWSLDAELRPSAIDAILNTLNRLPAAQPERKTGRWIEDGYSHYKAVCSECGEPCATYVVNTPRDRFCKWCGAKMEDNR